MGGTVGYPKPFWTADDARGALNRLRDSELSQAAKPVEETHEEYLSLTEQIEALEQRRREVMEVGKKTIRDYQAARYNLLLKRVSESGKAFCDFKDHVVEEVSLRLMWRKHYPAYFINHICKKCLAEIKVEKPRWHYLLEMREEGGVTFQMKGEEWKPLDPHETIDYRDPEVLKLVDANLARKYNLPTSFSETTFPPDLDHSFR